MNIYRPQVDETKYVIVTYWLANTNMKKNLDQMAWELAIGQSVGNPNVRNAWETDELFENHSCKIMDTKENLEGKAEGFVDIAFPIVNTNWDEDGVSHFLCQIMGGQLDIDGIDECVVCVIQWPDLVKEKFRGPKYGIKNIREYTGVYGKPLLGGIIKPKTGISPIILGKMVAELVEGGVNFIKEDEILANPAFCSLTDRMKIINPIIKGTKVIYCYAINGDSPYVTNRVKQVADAGGNGVHVNFWAGLGVYKSIRDLDLPIFLHFQKSGDKILTNPLHNYHIDWNVISGLAGMMGCDFIHAGMWGGYKSDNEDELRANLEITQSHGTMPALSCGMHPGLVQAINKRFGIDYLANCGGAIHGHPMGTGGGVRAMRQAIDGNHGAAYEMAIEKWGKVD